MKRRAIRALLGLLAGLPVVVGLPLSAHAQKGEAATVQNGETITLAIGETKIISAKDVKNYSEGVPGIVDVKLTTDGNNFVVAGRRPGSSTLLLIKNDGSQTTINIDVFMRAPQVIERELAQLLEGLPGVQVRRVGAHIVIDGTVASDADLKRVQHVASLYPQQVDSLVSVGMAGAGGPATLAGGEQRFVVRVDFYFVQYDTTATYAVGMAWPGSIATGATLGGTYDLLGGVPRTATATLSTQPLPRLDIASTRGWAKVLKHATVICNNGVDATFSNGGEQNFSVTTGLGVGIQKIPFGTNVELQSKFDPRTREIDVKVSAEIADLIPSVSGTSIPGRATSKLTTAVSLKLGQSIVLSGIRRESTVHTISGIPFLKDIPVLGVLFGTHGDDTEATDGAIFIVPSVIEAVPASAQELVNTAMSRFRDFHGSIDHLNSFEERPAGGGGMPAAKKE